MDNNLNLPKISESQRKCISHLLRNCEQALDGLLTIIEDPYSEISHDQLAKILQITSVQIVKVLKAAERGSFCPLVEDECRIVSSFTKCSGVPETIAIRSLD